MVHPFIRQRQHVEDLFDSSETEQCYFTIDNESTIPFTIYIKPSDDNDHLLSSEVGPGKRFMYPMSNDCNAAIEWAETPRLLATDVFVLCSLFSYALMMPFTIVTKGAFSLSMFDLILWNAILILSLYYFCKPRVANPILENRLTVENSSYRFYQKRSFTEGTLTEKRFFDLDQIPTPTST